MTDFLRQIRARGAQQSPAQLAHPWVIRLLLPIGKVVRFPFNSADSSAAQSLSWSSIDPNLRRPGGRFFNMPRWSTASRSSIALVPENLRHLDSFDDWPGEEERQEIEVGNPPELKVHMREWADLEHAFAHPMDLIRFHRIVGDPGSAVSPAGIMLPTGKRYRMYSIKTGVNFVGSKYEGPPVANKHRLEANSAMAMLRSNVARGLANNDRTFGLQEYPAPEIVVLAIPATYPQLPQQAPLNDGQILTAGDEGSYPHPTGSHAAYCHRVNHCLGLTAAELFERAA